MKFDVSVEGHAAQVDIAFDGKGGFTGTITSPEYGKGAITDGQDDGAGNIGGNVELMGHHARFTAHIAGNAISGTLRVAIFFSKSFTGTKVA
ncbi:hypothetical protein [uncultured Devosia sp.]|uniref:hypothetical protein n=1 Tax=uncultured Devosia sp. TaxID=211434 RepID=UPI002621EE37|nr:hypothetical protein [uncultured Devosia sp.]